MIYIDPPYNTGNDFVYNDDLRKVRASLKKQAVCLTKKVIRPLTQCNEIPRVTVVSIPIG